MGTLPADPIEVEWQFDALDLRPVERWLAALPARTTPTLPTITALAKPPRRLVDRYVDTEDWRVAQAGFVLRVRRRGRQEEATMKDTRPAGPGGLRQRVEVTEPIPAEGLSALGPDGPVGRRLHAVVGNRPLVQVLEIRTRRQPFSLRAGGTEVAEVALDETIIAVGAGQRPAQLRRVEVEVVPEWADALAPLVEELRSATGMAPATLSKFEAGLLAAGVAAPGPPDLGPLDVGPGAPTGTLAYAVIRRHLGVLLAKEPGTRLGDDIEELHDMRVATRRLRAAMDLFADVLPPQTAQLREELRWLADALGAVRDLDVQLERMDEMTAWAKGLPGAQGDDPLASLRALLQAEREVARGDLLDALDSPRWARLSGALVALARQGPDARTAAARRPAAVAVVPLVAGRHRAVLKAARRARRSGVAADYHRLRIRCKRLRYSLEFTVPLYGAPSQQFVRKLARLQDALGLMQDAAVASARLAALATAGAATGGAGAAGADGAAGMPAAPPLSPATIFVMGGIAEHYRRESEELLAAMPRHLAVVTGASWESLSAHIERARVRAEALAARAATTALPSFDAGASTPVAAEGAPPSPEAPAGVAVPDPGAQVTSPKATGDQETGDQETPGPGAPGRAPGTREASGPAPGGLGGDAEHVPSVNGQGPTDS